METFIGRFLLPLLLITASVLNWSLYSLHIFIACDMFASIISHSVGNKGGAGQYPAYLVGKANWDHESGRSPFVVYFLIAQLLVGIVSLVELYKNKLGLPPWRGTCWGNVESVINQLGSYIKVGSCFLLPAVQLFVGISHPSWVSLPFFICSCVGLIDWSLTSNFFGLFRWWRSVQMYAGFNIAMLYVYQLPVEFPKIVKKIAKFVGLYKISAESDWLEICSGLSLIVLFFMLSSIRFDLEEMEYIISTRDNDLTEHLLSSRHRFFIRQSRSGVRDTNVLVRGAVFRIFTINFFTYGFPLSLLALSFWSFHFTSIFAFGLLAYVGYIIYAFPSLFRLHWLNGLLLVFILLWAVSTYIFNVAYVFVNWKRGQDMKIWEFVGLWHYPVPGYFLLAQVGLGFLVALGNLVNNSVFTYVSNESEPIPNGNHTLQEREETTVLIVATIAWGLRKCSRPIMAALIFFIAMKPGFIHALYVIFFLIYLLSHSISRKIRQTLILLCEAHFALLYFVQINLISRYLDGQASICRRVLSELGLLESNSSWEFLEIAALACFCAIHDHAFDMLFSFSAVVQHTPFRPIGFSVLKAGLNKSVLLSVYAASTTRAVPEEPSHERRIASFLSAIGRKFLSAYRSWGTYVAFLTILFTVYTVRPNCISFGYLLLLLVWIIGRQLVERTKRRLWFPLKAYSIAVFIFIYGLSIFSSFTTWLSGLMDLDSILGYRPEASLLYNVWESLAVLIVMQLYSYERRQSKYVQPDCSKLMQPGLFGFVRRFLVWHSHKIVFVAVFYASISPLSAFGFLYLLGLVVFTTFSKASQIPSKSFLIYTGFLVTAEYLFQMWGERAEMFPRQKYSKLSLILGFQVFRHGFGGIESCLRGKVLVVAACTLQYNVFHWLDSIPSITLNKGTWEELCPLFVSGEGSLPVSNLDEENNPPIYVNTPSDQFKRESKNPSEPLPCLNLGDDSETNNIQNDSFGYSWGSYKDNQKWNRRRIVALRNDRYEMQKITLKVYLKFWTENMFNLFGLEINMIALLISSFVLLNAVSLLYITLLAAFVLLDRRIICKLWPILVFLFAVILILQYVATWYSAISANEEVFSPTAVHCHACWRSSSLYLQYCKRCWLGFIVDDPRVLISYVLVFMFACFKHRADCIPVLSGSVTYHQMMSNRRYIFVWKDLSFETKSMWTIFDYLRLYCYCHLLDLVLALILITGTLEYDILHLGYLGFALVFFRMRLKILRKRNEIFKFLRIYNFVIIVISLAYQSPFVGYYNEGKCGTICYIYEVVGFYKYDYGFRVTSRSALVEIIIFMLVSLQSYMFSSSEFEHVSRYLEAEQIGAIVHEQEKKAAWKNAQLSHIRHSKEEKRKRNLQVEKMKSEMLDLQIQLRSTPDLPEIGHFSPSSAGLRKRKNTYLNLDRNSLDQKIISEMMFPIEFPESPVTERGSPSTADTIKQEPREFNCNEITEIEELADLSVDETKRGKTEGQLKENPLMSAVQLIGDGVFQVQSLGNQAVTNLASFLNIADEDAERICHSVEEGRVADLDKWSNAGQMNSERSSLQSDRSKVDSATLQLGRICHHMWSQMRSNNDIVCYCCFVIVFLWNFSLLSMVYLGVLFLYALCVNTGPSYTFWIVILIYTEIYILLQYLYQIVIQHCGISILSPFLHELGFPENKINSSFVISSLPLFLVYLFTLLQSSITAQDGDWNSYKELSMFSKDCSERDTHLCSSWGENAEKLFQPAVILVNMVIRSLLGYWKSLTQGAESPPYFVQLSLDVGTWPEDGIQPEKIESGINQLLQLFHAHHCKEKTTKTSCFASRVNIQSIERSKEDTNLAFAVLEVVYATSLTDCKVADWYKSLTPATDVAKEILLAKHEGFVEEVEFPYPIISVIGGGKREVDLYAYIFCADLTVFFLVAIFYQSLIKNKSEILDVYQLEDQFPKEFVFILMVIFFLIVLDRIIYLCSFATGKVLFYLSSLILFTYSVTEYAWGMQPSLQYAGILAIRAIYLTKALSLALQAVQIRYGIPNKSTLYRQFLTSEVSRINYIGYRMYRALPFLYELRCVLDWSCTNTSLTMYDWLKLEDINASLYLVKCDAVLNRASHKSGEKQSNMTKFCNGFCLFFTLICVIWAPMLMYSSGNPTNIANPIRDVSIQVDLKTNGGKLTLYQTSVCQKIPWIKVNKDAILESLDFLRTYDWSDIQLICCEADASTLWLVPKVVQKRFIKSIDEDNEDMDITFSWVLMRDRPKGKEVVRFERTVEKPDLPRRSDVVDVLNGSATSFRVYNIYPRYFRVTGSGDVRPFEPELHRVNADLVINHEIPHWWSFYDINPLNETTCEGLEGPMAVIVSEETPQGILGDTLSKFSIWGLYITFVLAVGRFIRLQCADLRMRIPYENLPSPDRLIAICEDIYAARAEGELGVEEVLYWTLVKIYRSPHMLLDTGIYQTNTNPIVRSILEVLRSICRYS
ncbi:hypothetical protein V2J09_010816 [Rumex salicifolius]